MSGYSLLIIIKRGPWFLNLLTLTVRNPRQNALAPKHDAEAKKTSSWPQTSRHLPGPMGLATPFFRQMTRPREAEMMEVR